MIPPVQFCGFFDFWQKEKPFVTTILPQEPPSDSFVSSQQRHLNQLGKTPLADLASQLQYKPHTILGLLHPASNTAFIKGQVDQFTPMLPPPKPDYFREIPDIFSRFQTKLRHDAKIETQRLLQRLMSLASEQAQNLLEYKQ